MKIVNYFIYALVGIVFVVSGLIKTNDPIGTAIKMEEYFEVFATDLDAPLQSTDNPSTAVAHSAGHDFFMALKEKALPIAIFFVILEVVLGVMLLANFGRKLTAWLLLGLIIFFTFLTFYSAYFNKVTDCGCFGDAIKLTPWQSFGKDVVLLVLVSILLFQKKIENTFSALSAGIVVLSLIGSSFLAWYALENLPPIDFRAYKVGNNIPELRKPQAQPIYEYVMEKDGQEYRFSEYNMEEGYKFKEMITLNQDQVKPKIEDFAVWNDENTYTDSALVGEKLFVIVQKPQEVGALHQKALENIRALIKEIQAKRPQTQVWALTSAAGADYVAFDEVAQLQIPFFYADATVLKTIMRSNIGIWTLKEGTVTGKWHYNNVPNTDEVVALF
ncbi:BT_3928 family protein [Hugenholtzia roseola]|uniref:BT_3928 family protein n=1 Tax=Hugenholtzia roseola TaxID=1002 RepID=UPI0003FF5CE0|nr:BT_3928 family protein [Hugenholtzia roseola]